MVTASQCLKKYGKPELLTTQAKHFERWNVPQDIQDAFAHTWFSAVGRVGFPKVIFLNKDLKAPLERALSNVIARKLTAELKFWDGCFIIRNKRGANTQSLHSWAIAVDINQAENQMGKKPKLSRAFAQCFIDAGFDWGGDWDSPDGMHFQLARI